MKKQQGFTLIEMIIVVVLLAVTVGMTSDILMTLIRSNTKTQVLNEIEQQTNFVSLKIEKELRDAVEVNVDPFDNNLSFTTRDGTQITYSCDECAEGGTVGNITRSVGGGTRYAVTSDNSPGGVDVVCTNCFEIISSNPQVVKINMEFKQAQQGAGLSYSGSAVIDSSIVIRSSYR